MPNWRKELDKGDEVYWTDPDDGKCSGYYTVLAVRPDDVVLLQNDDGSEVEAWITEVS